MTFCFFKWCICTQNDKYNSYKSTQSYIFFILCEEQKRVPRLTEELLRLQLYVSFMLPPAGQCAYSKCSSAVSIEMSVTKTVSFFPLYSIMSSLRVFLKQNITECFCRHLKTHTNLEGGQLERSHSITIYPKLIHQATHKTSTFIFNTENTTNLYLKKKKRECQEILFL